MKTSIPPASSIAFAFELQVAKLRSDLQREQTIVKEILHLLEDRASYVLGDVLNIIQDPYQRLREENEDAQTVSSDIESESDASEVLSVHSLSSEESLEIFDIDDDLIVSESDDDEEHVENFDITNDLMSGSDDDEEDEEKEHVEVNDESESDDEEEELMSGSNDDEKNASDDEDGILKNITLFGVQPTSNSCVVRWEMNPKEAKEYHTSSYYSLLYFINQVNQRFGLYITRLWVKKLNMVGKDIGIESVKELFIFDLGSKFKISASEFKPEHIDIVYEYSSLCRLNYSELTDSA